ncbi:potassium channel protein [Halobacteriales archaeon QH_8_68_33]|nr:MAG: potassium channel protein [Halobacteriales archaeon QH_1_68_42]PSP92451.1 MAG: potassium channel protein [Halobacteriales archaeon QH_8_68_33]
MGSDTREQGRDAALEELFEYGERVRLVDWSSFSGAKTSVLLVGAVAVVAFVTGLSDLSGGAVALDGPLAGLVPGAGGLMRLYAVFFAFLLGPLALGLRRRLKIAWYGTLVALSLAALLPLLTAEATDLLLLLAALVALPHVVRNRGRFDQAVDLSAFQAAALAAFLGVQLYGTVGAYAMRGAFTGVDSLTDAFYYIVVTGTTVGYGDVTPTTDVTKLFALSVIVLGTISFTVASGSLLIPALESRISSAFGNMSASELSLLEDHVLVLGHGDITAPLLDELDGETDLVVVTEDTDAASSLRERELNVLTADPTDAESLRDARIDAAEGVVVATADDARDVLAVLAARQENPDVRVVAAATDRKHVEKLEGVGADRVISPTIIGGQLLGRSVLDEDAAVFGTDADAPAPEDADRPG